MKFSIIMAAAAGFALPGAGGAAVKDAAPARPEIFGKLVACRNMPEAAARLACYDAQVAAIDAAERNRELLIVDRAQIREARRSLFGLSLPRLAIFGGGKAGDDDEITEMSATVASARRDADSRWIIMLENGARWRQIDGNEIGRAPRPGMPVLIKRGALGSFRMSVAGQNAFKARREN